MERRGFLKALAGALAVAGVVKATPVESAPVAPAQTMTALSIERNMAMNSYFEPMLIVSQKQKEALEALVRAERSKPLCYADIERLEQMAVYR